MTLQKNRQIKVTKKNNNDLTKKLCFSSHSIQFNSSKSISDFARKVNKTEKINKKVSNVT